ncbi:GRIP and coiled-coil domain-containing protein 2-like [Maniola hyperantus]|uniref:GRIP and coiled-coil domain-containing protein 2-like n=1 Tax=Aphantopus hyperantus TaxID=2795564 RepID=UPI001567EB01|nr:uncharacterized protein PF11_0213 [Maniola hyperantus]
MSFITKRERVFNEYDLFDLPARNEGKLKAYASCTDARAWSHFCSDKSEHLVEIIKRNNETVRPKYIPTDVIVNMLMTAKNAEIGRLKRKIEEFDQMLSAYDQLDLTCEQKCDIANAHAAIKAANKELDDMCLDLDLSGYTEGIDSEAFETGKSRGDELSRYGMVETGKSGGGEMKALGEEWTFDKEKESTPRKETKCVQAEPPCTCDASTSAHDTQLEEMQETIITKDAKLSAMQNTIAVMEHDVCEPYCIYAHIYTALEKIFGTLCQNGKYKQYLDLLTAGKDTRGINIKGKILFKIKVLEKFSVALIAPCSQEFSRTSKDCSCMRAEVVTTFALTSAESQKPSLDNKRAQLVADIMDSQEMKEILSKESLCLKIEEDQFDECRGVDNNCIDVENLNRLKNLQANYDELLICYDNLKHERDCLYLRCQNITDLEHECECLKNNLREYNQLWTEKEYYRKRSEDIDTLKENFFILSEETSNIETKLKAEEEINKNKSQTVDQLRNENIKLEQKIGDTSVQFEKEKNVLICKLKEYECKIMCQDQQIKSLSDQIDKLLEQDRNTISPNENTLQSIQLINEIESQKEQIKNLKDDLCSSEEEKEYLQEEFEKKLELINELKYDVEEWKSRYEEALKSYNYFQLQVDELQNKNLIMNQELESKTSAIDNLNSLLNSKSREISKLMEEVDHKTAENIGLIKQFQVSRDSFDKNINSLMNEKRIAINSIITTKKESIELLKHLKANDDTYQSTKIELDTLNKVKSEICIAEDKTDEKIDNDILVKEIELLNEANYKNINILQHENMQLKQSFDLAKKESLILEQKLINHQTLLQKFENLKKSNENLLNEKETLQVKLNRSKCELDNLLHDFQLTKSKSESLLNQSEDIKENYAKLNNIYQEVLKERNILHKLLSDKDLEIKNLVQSLHLLKSENEHFNLKVQEISKLEKTITELENKCGKLLSEKKNLQNEFDIKIREINDLHNNLENKIEENQRLQNRIKIHQFQELTVSSSISALENENHSMQLDIDVVRKENIKLLDKFKRYENLENEYMELQQSYNKIKLVNENLQNDLVNLKKIHNEQNEYLKSLEEALVHSREENLSKTYSVNDFYADLKKEVEKLKEERLTKHMEMKTLMEKLDETECIITNLNEDIFARDKKISILENHINELQVEITANQNNLIEVVESGEQLKELSCEKLNQSVKKIEAHQSRATHNMKLELAKLQNEKDSLENQLSTTKSFTDETLREKNQYNTLINQLQHERELIISDIQQLETSCIGDSNLVPNNCSINEVITSLNRIGQYINSKNTSLEKTYLNVKASYQLLKSKADEAKNIAEKEQQKIIYEKEQTRKERIEIENQLENLKAKMKEEKTNYERITEDLEGEMLNQKLIFDNINHSKEDQLLKLIEENELLQSQCDSYDVEITELKQNLQNVSEQNTDMLENTKKALEKQDNLVIVLQTQIEDFKNKPTQETGIETIATTKDNECQTDEFNVKNSMLSDKSKYKDADTVKINVNKYHIADISNENDSYKNHKISHLYPIAPPNKEVQILTANVEPTIDFARNIYLKYKLKRLSPGKLEQHSIASLQETIFANNSAQDLTSSDHLISEAQNPRSSLSRNLNTQLKQNNDSIINIYHTQISTNSTKITDDINGVYTDISNKESKSLTTDLEYNDQDFENTNTSKTKNLKKNGNFKDSYQATEKDLFVIYKDSDSIFDGQEVPTKLKDTNSRQRTRAEKSGQPNVEEKINIEGNTSDDRDDDSMKPKLNINLPRVVNDSPSFMTNSDDDKISLDLYSNDTYASPQQIYSKTNKGPSHFKNSNSVPITFGNQIKQIFPEKMTKLESFENNSEHSIHSNRANVKKPVQNKAVFPHDSNHKLSRVGATILVLQNTVSDSVDEPSEDFNVKSKYGLQYILNTVQNEINPNNTKNLNVIKSVHKSHSNDQFINVSRSSQSNQFSPLKISSIEYATESTYSALPTNSVERGTLVKMNDIEDYESKILQLTKALEKNEKYYQQKIEAVKAQYDYNVQSIINEHNHGVKSIQNLHEERLHDINTIHENEVENLRTMSIEAMRKAEKLQVENHCLKSKLSNDTTMNLNEEPIKIPSTDSKKRKCRCRVNNRKLTKTNVEAFNVKPRQRSHGPCTCSLDMSISDTIRSIFEQVDVDQRRMAEQAYLKYIANKISDGNVEILDAQELSFLHLKVCRTWKTRLNKEEAMQMKIDTLETEVINKHRQQQKHMAEIDRKVAEELRRLQEVREAVCFSPHEWRDSNFASPPPAAISAVEKDIGSCNTSCNITVRERRSAGDLTSGLTAAVTTSWKRKRAKLQTSRAVLAKLDGCEERRDKGLVSNETPTRLKRAQDRPNTRIHKK